MERITCQKLIAEKLNLSQSAVSIALRDRPGVGKATRERVKAMAKELGYVPDPMLASLADYRNRTKPAAFRSVIPWLHLDENMWGHAGDSPWKLLYEGAKQRAEALGYRLEPIWLEAPGTNQRTLTRIFETRGISGALIAPYKGQTDWLERISEMPFASAAVGTYGLLQLPMDHVSSDHYQNARELVRRLELFGCERVGVCLSRRLDSVLLRQYSSIFSRLSLETNRKALWLLHTYRDDLSIDASLGDWLALNKPDTVVFHNETHYQHAIDVLGADIFKGVRIALLCRPDAQDEAAAEFAGIDEGLRDVGASAVDLLSTSIGTRMSNTSQRPRRLLVEGQWVEGSSLHR